MRLSSRWQFWIRRLAPVRLLLENTCPCLAQLLLAVALIATGQTEITQSQFVPPHMFLVIFLAAVPAQLLFGVAMMTMPAVLSILTFGLLYGSGVILSVFLLDAIGAPKRREFPPGCSNLEGLARGDPSLEGGTGFQRDIMSSGVYIFVGLGLFGYLEFFLFGYLFQSGPEDGNHDAGQTGSASK